MKKLTGPFKQIITMDHLERKGPIPDSTLKIIGNGGVIVEDGLIREVGDFEKLHKEYKVPVEEIFTSSVLTPGFIDAHTHICYAGSRAKDYAQKIQGITYQEILARGGGIYSTVNKTRQSDFDTLKNETFKRVDRHFNSGITTIEIKSGYGLSLVDEIKMLEVINSINETSNPDLIPTCLAAHVRPVEFNDNETYLDYIITDILPLIMERDLSRRVDIFIEENAFLPRESQKFLEKAQALGFTATVHADQFSRGGAKVAAAVGAVSADHLESSHDEDIKALVNKNVTAVVLPGASLGLAMDFAPARKILDAGACLVIASDWNPGSAPMGDLLTQSALLSNFEKLTFAETIAGITFRAAYALGIYDRGMLSQGKLADMISFPTDDHREILYNQGMLKPDMIWKNGNLFTKKSQ
jgi:imidazolonepropionase